MATESRRAPAAVADALQHEPWRFEFFQAVRLLEAMAHHATGVRGAPRLAPVGHAAASSQELVRFRTALSRGFPASEITGLVLGDEASPTARMEVAFIGLTGDRFFVQPPAPAGRLAGPVADATEDAGKHVALAVDHVRIVEAALRDQADVFGNVGMRGTAPLAIDYLVKIIRVRRVGPFHRRLWLPYSHSILNSAQA